MGNSPVVLESLGLIAGNMQLSELAGGLLFITNDVVIANEQLWVL